MNPQPQQQYVISSAQESPFLLYSKSPVGIVRLILIVKEFHFYIKLYF